MARYEAEEKIKARERQLTALKQGPDSPVPVTAHVQERSGESAAIIAEKAGIKTRNVYKGCFIILLFSYSPKTTYNVTVSSLENLS